MVKQLYFELIRFVTNFLGPRYTTFSTKSARKSIFILLIVINNASEKLDFSLAFRPMTKCSEFSSRYHKYTFSFKLKTGK